VAIASRLFRTGAGQRLKRILHGLRCGSFGQVTVAIQGKFGRAARLL